MAYYRRQPPDTTPPDKPEAMANAAVDSAGRLLRRLLPFPLSGDVTSLEIPLMTGRRSPTPESVASPLGSGAGPQAAAIVSEAASILDEEMAKGLLAARRANQFPRYGEADQ